MSVKPELERAEEEAEEGDDAAEGAAPLTMSELVQRGDVDGLMELAKAHRTGTGGVAKDLKRCFECYEAAAKLGSAAASYSAALFFVSGGVVEKDMKEAAARLRASAEAGYTPAKVYLANLYEQGVYYKADPAKADVWYRSAARSGDVAAEPGTPAYRRAMAELGAVRYCLEIARDPKSTADDKARFIKKAKAFGYREKGAESEAERMSQLPESVVAPRVVEAAAQATIPERRARASDGGELKDRAEKSDATATKEAAPAADPVKQTEAVLAKANAALEKAEQRAAKTKPKSAPLMERLEIDWGDGFTAFFFAIVLMGAGFALGHALTLGATGILAKAGAGAVPIVGAHVELILPIAISLLGVLPALLVYRLPTWARALAVAALAGIAGEMAWGAKYVFVATRLVQVTAFAAAGFLAALLVLGIFGGTRSGYKTRHLKKIGIGMPLRVKKGLERD